MAFDAFLHIDGIPGESKDERHTDWIEVTQFSHALDQPASLTASSVGGAGAERVNHGMFQFKHLVDKSSPKLYDACCSGKHIPEIVLEVCRAGGEQLKYFEVRLQEVLISKVQLDSRSSNAQFPEESVSLSYGKIRWIYTQQKRSDGGGSGNITAGWDLTANRQIA